MKKVLEVWRNPSVYKDWFRTEASKQVEAKEVKGHTDS
jgi:hypothetical protein